MSQLSFAALLGYLLILAASQTVYGGGFLAMRWAALTLLLLATGADLVMAKGRARPVHSDRTSDNFLFYVLISATTVVFAESPLFSAARWGTHIAMLLVFLVFVRQIIHFRQIQRIMWIIRLTMLGLILVSWLYPAERTIFENVNLFRGAMGNANTMGHVAAIAAILFTHDYFTAVKTNRRLAFGLIAVAASSVVWYSGARSSLVAFISALALMAFYYRERMRGIALVLVLAIGMAAVAFPGLPNELVRFAVKREDHRRTFSEQALKTRTPLWTASWSGFATRPWFGWGFGADSNVRRDWKLQSTALGTVERDAVNDVLFMLEGGGLAGFVGYLLLIVICMRQRPGPAQRSLLRRFSLANSKPGGAGPGVCHSHASAFILLSGLLVLTQLDSTALSAGNLVSVVVWISAACAGALNAIAHKSAAAPCSEHTRQHAPHSHRVEAPA